MKIVSYNLNGIRSAMNKGLLDWLREENPDVFCVQELKAQPDQVDVLAFAELGYLSYLHAAEKKGYSGVGIFSKREPDYVKAGMCSSEFTPEQNQRYAKYDAEGRVLRADFGDSQTGVTVVCVYVPSGTTGDVRQDFKMEFLADFLPWINALRQQRPNVIICGDYNICHKPIDINHPERQKGVSGFLPEEREWLDRFEASGLIDSFRVFCSDPEQYSWWSMRFGARARNAGWRIDYHWVSQPLKERLRNATILQQVVHSDHCPVVVEID